jgi:hypothetical protein
MRSLTNLLHLVKPADGDRDAWNIPVNVTWDRLDSMSALSNGVVVPVDIDMSTGIPTSLLVKINPCRYENEIGLSREYAGSGPIALPPNATTKVWLHPDGDPVTSPDWPDDQIYFLRLASVTTGPTAVMLPIDDYRFRPKMTPQLFVNFDESYLPYGSASTAPAFRLGAPVTSIDGYPVQTTPDNPNAPMVRRIMYFFENDDIYVSLPMAINNIGKVLVVTSEMATGNATTSPGSVHLKELSGRDFSRNPTIGTKGLRLNPGELWWFTGSSEDGYDTIAFCPIPPIDPA